MTSQSRKPHTAADIGIKPTANAEILPSKPPELPDSINSLDAIFKQVLDDIRQTDNIEQFNKLRTETIAKMPRELVMLLNPLICYSADESITNAADMAFDLGILTEMMVKADNLDETKSFWMWHEVVTFDANLCPKPGA